MAFNGRIESDYLKYVKVEDFDKESLINFAATDFLELRASLINYIKAVYPLDYQYFSESDLGMMLVELVAYMGHILSYKADYLANENYLKTARSRESVRKMLQLIGVRMRGPIASAADAKITLEQTPSWQSTSYLTITPDNRVVSVTSPEDGQPISYTLYKVAADGDIDLENSNGNIIITNSEKASATTVSSLILLEGSLVVQEGTFSDTESLKSVRLNKSPLAEGSVQVFVQTGDNTPVKYDQVDNIFYASGLESKVFQLVSDQNYGAVVVFGDNNIGRSPAIGDSFKIIYRVGGGSRGNIPRSFVNAQSSVTFRATPTSTDQEIPVTVENTSKSTGGADAETITHAKKYGPLMFRSQDRLVTLTDYKAFINSYITSYGSIGKATVATRKAYSSANIIDVFVLEKSDNIQLRKSTPEFKRQLLTAIQDKKMITDEVVVVDGLIRTLDLIITLRVDKKYSPTENVIKNKVKDKILSFFNVDNNDFGKEFIPQELLYKIFEVPEVRFAVVENVPDSIKINFNEIIQLNNFTLNIVYV